MSEFDQYRRQHVMEIATTYRQVIITSADVSAFSPKTLANANVFNMKQGVVSPKPDSSLA
jgi:recombinational DNA repair ATPase RecF